MLTKRIIPCLDVKEGRVVKGVRFVDLRDAGDPVEIAAAYDEQGADELCFLDINASHEKRGTMLDLVARTADRVMIPFSVGGGVRSVEDVRALLKAGAAIPTTPLGAGRSTRTGGAGRAGATPSSGRSRWSARARESSCSPAWTATARSRATTSS